MRRTKKKDLREGQVWDDILSGGINAVERKIITLGTDLLTYEDIFGKRRTIKINSFLSWANSTAVCSELKEAKGIDG